jgi:hypothetical protein
LDETTTTSSALCPATERFVGGDDQEFTVAIAGKDKSKVAPANKATDEVFVIDTNEVP